MWSRLRLKIWILKELGTYTNLLLLLSINNTIKLHCIFQFQQKQINIFNLIYLYIDNIRFNYFDICINNIVYIISWTSIRYIYY